MRGRQWRAALTALLLGLTALLPRPAVADPDDELQMVLVDCALFGLSSGCTDREYHEGEGTVSIPIDVEISGAWNSDLDWGSSLTGEVDYRIETVGMGETGAPEGATAVEGEDFQAFSEDYSDAFTGVRTRLRQTITVAIINDTVLENDEKFYLKVTVLDTTDFAFGGDVVDYAASTRVLDGPAEILTISANDPAITLTVSRKSITEDADDTPVTVTGTLNPVLLATDTAVTVSVVGDTATVDTDFTAVPDFGLTIRANARSGTATFTFTSIDDQLVEGSETVTVTGTTTGTSRTVQPATLTLTDNDVDSTRVSLAVSLPSVTEDAAATPITVTATLDEAPRTTDTAVTVSVVGDTATKDTDFTAVLDFGLTIRANAHSGTATFTLTPIDDQLVEGSETVTVTGTTTASLIVQPATLTLTDNDVDSTRVSLAVSLPSVTEDAAATPITVTATLDEAPRTEDTAVTVSVVGDTATVDTDFTAVPDFGLTIRANAHSGTATFILTPIDDQHGEGSETVTVTGTTTATSLTVQPATLTLTDNDVASTRVSLAVSLASVTEDAAATPITVTGTLDGAPRTEDTAVTVSVVGDTATVGTDFTAVSDFGLTIRANARSGTATFTLTPIDDQYREGSETVTVTGTATATSLTVEPATLTLADDDVASTRVSLAASPASVTEDAAATPITVTGTLDGAPRTEDTAVTVSVVGDTATVGTDFTAVSDFGLTIRANAHSGTATFTLTPIDDQQVEGSETVTVTGTTTATSLTVTPTRLTLSDDAADGLPPPELSIADVRATEGRHAAAEFSVSLNRATVRTVTVDYATADGSAKAGADYTATRGTLTFAAGERSRTITVALLDDALDEIEETFTVTLSDARHARLADATGTATIRDDSDPMPQAWLARFARTASENVLDAVAARVTAQRFGVPQATLRGRGLDAAWSQSSDADEQARLAALAAWIRSGPEPARVVSGQDLLAGSGFVAPAVAGGALTIWGQGAYGQFQARPGGVEGNVATGMLGLDHAMGPWLMGLAVSHSEGWGSYARPNTSRGEVSGSVTGAYSYARYEASPGQLWVWALGGLGLGGLHLGQPEASGVKRDLMLVMGAAGVRAELVANNGVVLRTYTDGLLLRAASKQLAGLPAATGDVRRLRLGLQGEFAVAFDDGSRLAHSLEAAARYDDGHAGPDFGAELGTGLSYAHHGLGLTAGLHVRAVLLNQSTGIAEWGTSGWVTFDPDPTSELGPALSVRPAFGVPASRDTLAVHRANAATADAGGRVDMSFGFGLPALGGVATPSAGFGLADRSREYRLGAALDVGAADLRIAVEATRRQRAGHDDPEDTLNLSLALRW